MRTLALALLLLASSIALASPHPVETVAHVIANHLDATILECPFERDEPIACYAYAGNIDLHKLALDVFVMGARDVTWLAPWQASSGALARVFRVGADGGQFVIAVVPSELGSLAVLQFALE